MFIDLLKKKVRKKFKVALSPLLLDKKTVKSQNNDRSRDLVNLIREFFVRETNEVKRV